MISGCNAEIIFIKIKIHFNELLLKIDVVLPQSQVNQLFNSCQQFLGNAAAKHGMAEYSRELWGQGAEFALAGKRSFKAHIPEALHSFPTRRSSDLADYCRPFRAGRCASP